MKLFSIVRPAQKAKDTPVTGWKSWFVFQKKPPEGWSTWKKVLFWVYTGLIYTAATFGVAVVSLAFAASEYGGEMFDSYFEFPLLIFLNVFPVLLLGALLYFSQFVQTVACGRTTAGKVSFITGLYVVLVPLCGAAVFRQRLCRGHWVAICLALPGLFFLTSAGVGFNYGDALALAGSFGFAIHMLASERFVARSSAVLLSMLQFAWAAVFSTVTLLFAGEPLLVPELTVGIGMRFLFMGLVSTLLGFFLQMWGQKQVPASLASMLLATEALFGLLFSVLLLDEVLTSGMVLGGALMLAAILVAERVAGPSDVSI